MKTKSRAAMTAIVFGLMIMTAGASWATDNGTVTINGLVWLKNSCLGTMTWNVAMTGVVNFKSGSCPGLNDNSKAGDWRLPTKDELVAVYPSVSKLGNLRNDYYWSSTEAFGTSAYIMHMGNGSISTFSKTSEQYVIVVRNP